MVNPKVRSSEYIKVLGVIDPDANTAAAYSTGYVNAGNWTRLLAIVFAGTLGTSATLDAKLEQASAAGGTGVKDVTGKAITQLTEAGTDSDKQAIINLDPNELDINNGFEFVRLTMTVGTATSDSGAVLIGIGPRNSSVADATTVDEIVS